MLTSAPCSYQISLAPDLNEIAAMTTANDKFDATNPKSTKWHDRWIEFAGGASAAGSAITFTGIGAGALSLFLTGDAALYGATVPAIVVGAFSHVVGTDYIDDGVRDRTPTRKRTLARTVGGAFTVLAALAASGFAAYRCDVTLASPTKPISAVPETRPGTVITRSCSTNNLGRRSGSPRLWRA